MGNGPCWRAAGPNATGPIRDARHHALGRIFPDCVAPRGSGGSGPRFAGEGTLVLYPLALVRIHEVAGQSRRIPCRRAGSRQVAVGSPGTDAGPVGLALSLQSAVSGPPGPVAGCAVACGPTGPPAKPCPSCPDPGTPRARFQGLRAGDRESPAIARGSRAGAAESRASAAGSKGGYPKSISPDWEIPVGGPASTVRRLADAVRRGGISRLDRWISWRIPVSSGDAVRCMRPAPFDAGARMSHAMFPDPCSGNAVWRDSPAEPPKTAG
jgi:hypothetical protein